jgi:hypothetical protein
MSNLKKGCTNVSSFPQVQGDTLVELSSLVKPMKLIRDGGKTVYVVFKYLS